MNSRKFSTNVFRVNSSEQMKFIKNKVDKVIKILRKKETLKNKKIDTLSKQIKANKQFANLINKIESLTRVILGFSILSVVFYGSYKNYVSREKAKFYADATYIISTSLNFSTIFLFNGFFRSSYIYPNSKLNFKTFYFLILFLYSVPIISRETNILKNYTQFIPLILNSIIYINLFKSGYSIFSNVKLMQDNINILTKFMLTSVLCSAFSIHANYAFNKEERFYLKDLELEKIKSI